MKYLVLEYDRAKVVDAKKLRAWIDHTSGPIRIFRLCGVTDPKELFVRGDLIVDRFGNIEGV